MLECLLQLRWPARAAARQPAGRQATVVTMIVVTRDARGVASAARAGKGVGRPLMAVALAARDGHGGRTRGTSAGGG
jgi:hypothetical protein